MRHSAVHNSLAVCGCRLITRRASVASQKLPNEDPGLRPSHGPDLSLSENCSMRRPVRLSKLDKGPGHSSPQPTP
jgi:hypothetical protein